MLFYLVSLDVAVANVVVDAHVEQDGLLRDKAYLGAQPSYVELANVHAVQVDCAAVHVVESQ